MADKDNDGGKSGSKKNQPKMGKEKSQLMIPERIPDQETE